MKALLFVCSMQCGGAERVAANLANAWAARGDEVSVVTLTSADTDFYPLDASVQRIQLDLYRAARGALSGLAANLQRVFALRRVLIERQPDVVLGIMTTASIIAILAARGLGCKVIATEHTHPPRLPLNRFWTLLRRGLLPRAHGVVALNSDSRDWLERHGGCANVRVIPPPLTWPVPRVEPVVAPERIVPAERRVLLAVGRLAKEKGFGDLVEAFAAIAPSLPRWDLVIAGEGPEREALEAQIRAAGLGARIVLAGRVGNVADWYARADLYVLSSHYEGFSMTLVEAMASGCAAVSYDCDTGPRDIIAHGVSGLLVQPVGDRGALAAALRELMADDLKRARMARHATAAGEAYSLVKTIAMWRKLFAETGAPAPARE